MWSIGCPFSSNGNANIYTVGSHKENDSVLGSLFYSSYWPSKGGSSMGVMLGVWQVCVLSSPFQTEESSPKSLIINHATYQAFIVTTVPELTIYHIASISPNNIWICLALSTWPGGWVMQVMSLSLLILHCVALGILKDRPLCLTGLTGWAEGCSPLPFPEQCPWKLELLVSGKSMLH